MDSTQFANSEKYNPCWATLNKLYQTKELHSLHENSEISAVNKESVISDLYHIILQQTEWPNASFKCSNVFIGRIRIKLSTIVLKPQNANSIQIAKFIVFFKDIVQYPTLRADGHYRNYISVEKFKRH